MRYLVTGGAGFVGSALVKRLCADGHEVRVLDDMSRGNPGRLAGTGADIAYGDVRDPGAVIRGMHGCGGVVHAAFAQGTQTFYENPVRVLDVAVRGILNVLDACRVTGCGDLLLISSSEAYQVAAEVPTPETVPLTVPDPLNPRYSYGGGKIISEIMGNAWQREGILDRLVIARPHNIYGINGGYEHVIPEMATRMCRLIGERREEGPVLFPIQGTGLETRSFCHIDDCTNALALLLEEAGPLGVYHVGNPEEVTIANVAHLIGKQYGRDVKVVPGTLPKGSPPRRCPDISKMRDLGFRPQISLAQGIGPVLDWYRDHPKR